MIDTEKINMEKVKYEDLQLVPGETNWFKVLTSSSFVIRLAIVLVFTIVNSLIILNVTLDPNSKSWYNKLHKPDWMPDSIIVVCLFAFLSLLLAWVWYRLNEMTEGYWNYAINVWMFIILGLQFSYTLCLYSQQSIKAGKYLICFYLGFVALLCIFCLWFVGFSDVGLYTFVYVAWLVLALCYTFNLHELDKEYKMLGLVKNKNSKLYKKKINMEIIEGIRITEDGQKIEVIPDEQE
jgi:tryptophan-rich sensory protein